MITIVSAHYVWSYIYIYIYIYINIIYIYISHYLNVNTFKTNTMTVRQITKTPSYEYIKTTSRMCKNYVESKLKISYKYIKHEFK